MRAVVGVTDDDWASYLRERPHLTEANFWLPSPQRSFRSLDIGEPFLFKTHWPDNRMVGGGFYSGYDTLTVSEAWELFGQGNGVASEDALARKIANYRKQLPDRSAPIGCVMLRDLFFVPVAEALAAPMDFAKNIVRFKGYDLSTTGRHVDVMFSALLGRADVRISDEYSGIASVVPGPVFGRERLTRQRAGQQAFKGLVLASYGRRCAVTGNHIKPILEAAHIRPVSREGVNLVSNGPSFR